MTSAPAAAPPAVTAPTVPHLASLNQHAFTITSPRVANSQCHARAGMLLNKLPTPNVLLYTQRGTPPFTTIDHLHKYHSQQINDNNGQLAFHLTLSQLIGVVPSGSNAIVPQAHAQPRPKKVKKRKHNDLVDAADQTPVANGNGSALHNAAEVIEPTADLLVVSVEADATANVAVPLPPPNKPLDFHHHLQLQNHILYMSIRDPLTHPYGPSNDAAYSLHTILGKYKLTPDSYVQHLLAYQPDIAVLLADEFGGGQNQNAAKQRKRVDRSIQWLDMILNKLAESEQSTKATTKLPLLFAAIQGCVNDADTAIQCAQQMLQRDAALSGYVVPAIDHIQQAGDIQQQLQSIIQLLPSSKPRVLTGSGTPFDILHGVYNGIDLFESQYPYMLTSLSSAAVFPLDVSSTDEQAAHTTKLNLRDPCYELDRKPLLDGCQCYTCRTHTRAYIHHLLNVHELLSDILLQTHNLYHYLEFIATVRKHIAAGTYNDYYQRMLKVFQPKAT